MANYVDINDLRQDSNESKYPFRKSMVGGYNMKDVDTYIEMLEEQKEKIVKSYNEQISELQTSLNMVVRERDNSIQEKSSSQEETAKLNQEIQNLINLNEELTQKVNELTIELETIVENHEDTVVVPEIEEDLSEKFKLELKVENEQLIKNCNEQALKIEKLNDKLMDLTTQLSSERAKSQAEVLKLQGELHKKNVTCKMITSNILDNLSVVIKEVETLNMD